MGKIIKPDPDLWKSPVRKAAVEDRFKEREDFAKSDRDRRKVVFVVAFALLAPFLYFIIKFLFR